MKKIDMSKHFNQIHESNSKNPVRVLHIPVKKGDLVCTGQPIIVVETDDGVDQILAIKEGKVK